jgi:ankyrin repeat protein
VNSGIAATATTPLNIACIAGWTDMVGALLSHEDVDVNLPQNGSDGGDPATPLYNACEQRHVQTVRMLLADARVDVNHTVGEANWTPLFTVCHNGARRGGLEMLHLLLARPGLDVNLPNSGGKTPLARACARRHTSVVRALVAHPYTDLNQTDGDGTTPVHIAAQNGSEELVQLLAVFGADTALNDGAEEGVAAADNVRCSFPTMGSAVLGLELCRSRHRTALLSLWCVLNVTQKGNPCPTQRCTPACAFGFEFHPAGCG